MPRLDFDTARDNMIKQQLRTWHVLDETVLAAVAAIPRERFVPPAWRALALADMEIPLGAGAAMWQPKQEARVLQALQVQPEDRVLEIGTGSGYFAALLARLSQHVLTVEIEPVLLEAAREHLRQADCNMIEAVVGDAARGWQADATYDVIVASGSYPMQPDALIDQLTPEGRLFVVLGEEPLMEAWLYTKRLNGLRCERLFEMNLVPLRNAPQPPGFCF